jgi:hypothetical protein
MQNLFFRQSAISLFLVSVIFLLSCASQAVLRLPKNLDKLGSGTIRATTPLLFERKNSLKIQAVDGILVEEGTIEKVVRAGLRNIQVRVEVIKRECKLKCKESITKIDTTLTFEVLADKKYILDLAEEADKIFVRAYEEQSKEVVAGVRI